MTTDRFVFQRDCAGRVSGKVLNVGCKEDPAVLKGTYPDRVTNLDLRDYDDAIFHTEDGRKQPIPVDVIHDATVAPWPFEDDSFDLVVIGDLLEDLPDDGCQLTLLREANRISTHLCVTTPEDTPERDDHHQTTITEQRLRDWLGMTGWTPVDFNVVDYGFVPRGYLVFAERTACAETSSSTSTTEASPADSSPPSPEADSVTSPSS